MFNHCMRIHYFSFCLYEKEKTISMSIFTPESFLVLDDDCSRIFGDFQHYCNYPEVSKSRHNLRVSLNDSQSISNDSSSTLPSLISDISEPTSGLGIFHKESASASLFNFISSSSQKESYSKCEKEELENDSEESDSDSPSVDNNYVILKKTILNDVHKSCSLSGDPTGWLKFSLDLDPWSKTHYATNDSKICQNKTLTREMVAAGCCEIGQLPDTKAFALIRLHINKKELEDISVLSDYRYFQYIDMSWNYLSDLNPLSNCDYLMYLNASHNKLTEVLNMKPPWFLVYSDLSCNEIRQIGDRIQNFWSLRHLDLSYNHISKIQGLNNLKYLEYLNLSHNYIESVEQFDCPRLEELHIEYNKITIFYAENISLPNLKILTIGHNKITSLLSFEHLQTINKLTLNNNCIYDLCELSYLSKYSKLRYLNMSGNPICHIPGYREFAIYKMKTLKNLDDILVSSGERVYAKILLQPDIFSSIQSLRTKVELWNQLATPRIDIETKPFDQGPAPILVLVGTFANYKEELADMLVQKYPDKIYRINKHTTLPLTNSIDQSHLVSISMDEFNSFIKGGELLFHYKEVGNYFGVHRKELCNLILENKIGVMEIVLEAAMVMRVTGFHPYMVLCVTDDDNAYANRLQSLFDKLELWRKYDSQVCEDWTSGASKTEFQSFDSSERFDGKEELESLQDLTVNSTEEFNQKYGFDQCDPDFVWTWSIESTVSTKESEPDAEYLNRERGKEIFVHKTLEQQNLYIEFNNQHPGMFKASVLTNNLKVALKVIEEVCSNLLQDKANFKTIQNVRNDIINTQFVKDRVLFIMRDILNKS